MYVVCNMYAIVHSLHTTQLVATFIHIMDISELSFKNKKK